MIKRMILKRSGQAVLIWLCTNIFACIAYLVIDHSNDERWTIACIGAIFSSPVILFLIPALLLMTFTFSVMKRVIFGLALITSLCLGVLFVFFTVFGVSFNQQLEIVLFLWPYLIGALLSFFLVTWKMYRIAPAKLEEASEQQISL